MLIYFTRKVEKGLLPAFSLPLPGKDEAPLIDLNELLPTPYDRAGYDLRINYRAEPLPPLNKDDVA